MLDLILRKTKLSSCENILIILVASITNLLLLIALLLHHRRISALQKYINIMKRQTESSDEESEYIRTKRSHWETADTEFREFMDNYNVAYGTSLRLNLRHMNLFPNGIYFSLPASYTTTAIARQRVINYYNLFTVHQITDFIQPLVSHLDWPTGYRALYGYLPPTRQFTVQGPCQSEVCDMTESL